MPFLHIFTDSLADLPQVFLEKYQIGVIPVYVVFNNKKILKDILDITADQTCELVQEKGRIPGIAAPSTNDYLSAFTPVISAGDNILYISVSSEVSPAYKNAIAAAHTFPMGRVQIMDSKTLSSGTALMVMKAALLARRGLQSYAIIKKLNEYRQKMHFTMLLDNTGTSMMQGNVYGLENRVINPLTLGDKKVKCGKFLKRNSAKYVDAVLGDILERQNEIDSKLIIISQTLAERPAEFLKAKIINMTSLKTILVVPSICGLLSRTKPRSLAISYALD